MKSKSLLAIVVVSVMVVSLAGCGEQAGNVGDLKTQLSALQTRVEQLELKQADQQSEIDDHETRLGAAEFAIDEGKQ